MTKGAPPEGTARPLEEPPDLPAEQTADAPVVDQASGDAKAMRAAPPGGAANAGEGPLDLSAEEPADKQATVAVREVDARDLLGFAKLITRGIAWVGVLFAVLAIATPVLLNGVTSKTDIQYGVELSRQLLTVVTSILPPILTLVLGFYFGRKG